MSQKIINLFNGDEIAKNLQFKYNRMLQSFIKTKNHKSFIKNEDNAAKIDVVKLLNFYYSGSKGNNLSKI